MPFFTRAALTFLLATSTSVLCTGEGPVVQGATPPFQITEPATSVTWNLEDTVNISWSVPSSIPSAYTAADGYGCNIALFQASDHTTLVVYVSQQAVFSSGTFTWAVDGSFPNGSSYAVGVGFQSYVVGTANILIISSPLTSTSSLASSTVTPNVTTIVSVATSACTNVTKTSTSYIAAPSNSTTQQQASPATSNSQFQAVGGVGGVIGICFGGVVVVGGILGIMFYNSFRERNGRPPGLGSGVGTESRYGGGGSSYGVDHRDIGAETKIISPSTSPALHPVNLPPLTAMGAGSRSTYTPFSKRNPNPHHDNIDLLQVDPFVKPVPAYVLRPDIEHGADDHRRMENEGDDEMKQYNYI